jgi:hypothetical protein
VNPRQCPQAIRARLNRPLGPFQQRSKRRGKYSSHQVGRSTKLKALLQRQCPQAIRARLNRPLGPFQQRSKRRGKYSSHQVGRSTKLKALLQKGPETKKQLH